MSINNQPYKATTLSVLGFTMLLLLLLLLVCLHFELLIQDQTSKCVGALQFLLLSFIHGERFHRPGYAQLGGKEWRFESLPVPRSEVKVPGDIEGLSLWTTFCPAVASLTASRPLS